jgi:Nif-specific regulatory protein
MKDIPQQYLQALLEISNQINSIKEPEILLENILDIALQQLSAERGFILLKENGEYVPRAVRNIEKQKLDEIDDISHSTIQKVIEKKQPLLSFDALSDGRFDDSQSVILNQIQSIATVPLVLKGELIGVIYIDSRGQKARFSKQSLNFLQAFANQAAIALENARLIVGFQQENAILKEEFHRIYAFEEIIGKSKAMEQVFQMMGKVLNNDTNVLLMGETGTGKELVAKAIHYNGSRSKKAFVPVNCGAIPESLIESELFGHKKGAFTGAINDKEGLIKVADGGTLFLDEVGELPPTVQVKLLRFLQDRQFTPVGEVNPHTVDVRIITATNRDLQKAISQGIFREDLYYRLHVIHIIIPPLRERKKDIPVLTQYFLQKFGDKLEKRIKSVSPSAMDLLLQYDWPGNVRELENTLERAVVLDSNNCIDVEDLMLVLDDGKPSGIVAGMKLEDLSKELLEKTLIAVEGNKTLAADMMGVSVRWVHYKAKEWGLK